MKYLYLLSAALVALICPEPGFAQDLDFNTTAPLYPDGARSHSYTSIGTPAVNVDISVDGPGQFSNLSPGPASTGLYTPSVDFNTSGETQNYSFTFGDPVTGLEFSIIALQYKTDFTNPQSYYQDKVIIVATDEFGNAVMPVIPAGAGYTVNGNEILATDTIRTTVDKVRFLTKVKNVTILFGNGPLAGSNPRPQGFTIGDMDWSGVVLPVELAFFRGKAIGSIVQLTWETVSEQNADYFVVEHGLDLSHFRPIGRVKAAGESTRRQSYAFADEQAHRITNYYRLVQVDRDGTKRHSKIIGVRHDRFLRALTVYPNPSDGRSIHLQANDIESASLRLSDLSGRTLPARLSTIASGQTVLEPETPLPAGIYLLRADGIDAVRVLVQPN
ncbi:T9SS type A sorting domain-containing protein [Larkinella sp. VNQ87]|uniref:T9SS type A sorting domain-containing protein n=1 Tax=Larkinella sp. VNQ87 TaxID=3400921 RepID=UPI003C0ECA27